VRGRAEQDEEEGRACSCRFHVVRVVVGHGPVMDCRDADTRVHRPNGRCPVGMNGRL
jgi:hypothetical protein